MQCKKMIFKRHLYTFIFYLKNKIKTLKANSMSRFITYLYLKKKKKTYTKEKKSRRRI